MADISSEPPLTVSPTLLAAALHCTPFQHPDEPPVLLVHGTVVTGYEQWQWSYMPLLAARGFDVCSVTYPNRGAGDMQVSAEYVVYALRTIHATTGRKVAMIGHSQGGLMPRWALKWWPSARAATADFVLLAGPSHGGSGAMLSRFVQGLSIPGLLPGLLPEVVYQWDPKSRFLAALNAGDETPGDVDYTSIYTLTDEFVQPVLPVPTAALDGGQSNPKVSNIMLQSICPLNFVEHITIGTTDRVAFELTLDAIQRPGPANVQRTKSNLGWWNPLCGLIPFIPQDIFAPNAAQQLINVIKNDIATAPLPVIPLASQEPALKPYAQLNP